MTTREVKQPTHKVDSINIKSKNIQLPGANMHYLEAGQGQPILFIHGMPTSSYVWRHVLPHAATQGLCIAPDLIGMGESSKPDIEYSVFEQVDYLSAFIDSLALGQIILVMHGWGSVIGFELARRHEKRIAGMAFYESHVRPTTKWDMLSLPVQQWASSLKRKKLTQRAILNSDYFVDELFPSGSLHHFSDAEMDVYRAPFYDSDSRRPLLKYLQELPIGQSSDVVDMIADYSEWLQRSECPKLMWYGIPGFITTIDTVQWAKQNLPNLELAELQDVLHFAQESCPDQFAKPLLDWLQLKF